MQICLRRRDFIAGLGGAAAWPLAARAQQQKPIIGWLLTQPGVPRRGVIDAFRRGLAEIGFLERPRRDGRVPHSRGPSRTAAVACR